MTIADIANLACNECGDSGPDMLSYVKTQIRMKYEILYNSHPWEEAQIQPHYEFAAQPALALPSPSSSFWMPQIMPLSIDKVLWVRFSTDAGVSFPYLLKPRSRDWIERAGEQGQGNAFITSTGNQLPQFFFHGQPVGFPLYSPGILTFTPQTIASGFSVTIEGRDTSGLEQSETFVLNGVTPISSTFNYAEVHTISKSATGTAQVVVTCTGGATTLTMQPNDENMRFTVFVMWPAYNGTPSLQIRVGGKLKVDPIPNDNSIPRISGLHTALYYFARAAVHGKQKQWDLEQADSQRCDQVLSKLIEYEMSSEAAFQQIVPKMYDDPNDAWDFGTFWGY